MSKKISLIFVSILVIILISIVYFPVMAQTMHKVSCCQLSYEITLDDIDICAPVGCDPETAGCCVRVPSQTFLEGDIIGPAEDGVTQCWLGSSQVNIGIATPHWGMVCLINTIYSITDWVFWFALALSIIIGIVTGFFFLTAGGEPYKIEKARGMFIWLVVGIAVAVSAKVLTALIIAIVL